MAGYSRRFTKPESDCGTAPVEGTETMPDRSELESTDAEAPQTPDPAGKKPFVTPRISAPVDVLEATTFFQSVESGTTN